MESTKGMNIPDKSGIERTAGHAHRVKKVLAWVLSVCMIVTLMPMTAFAATDTSGHWAQATIDKWEQAGLIKGYEDGSFKPDKAMTRAEFAKVMNGALELKTTGTVAFSDVSSADWFYNDVAIAVGEGYTTGYEDGTFKPNDTITRAQAATIVARAKKLSGGSVSAFTDAAAIADWAKDSVGAMVQAGYISGYPDGTFGPNGNLTRAEAVTILEKVKNGGGSSTTPVTPADDLKELTITTASTVKDKIVDGNVTIDAAVGSGTVTLENMTIKGDLIVDGGKSVNLKNTTVSGKIIVNKADAAVSLQGTSKVSNVEINKAGSLDVASGITVSNVTANAKASLTGSGTISTLNANADGITYGSNLTISKTNTADGIKEPTKAAVSSGGGGSSSGGGGDTTITTSDIQTAADLKAAAEKSATNVTASVAEKNSILATDDIEITNNSVKNLTLNLDKISLGNVTINAANATTITLNDNATDGSNFASLTVNAPNAHVVNNVKVLGETTIKAVANSTFIVKDSAASIVMAGKGKLDVQSTAAPEITVATNQNVTLTGKIAAVAVTENANLTVSSLTEGSAPIINSQASNVTVNVATNNKITLEGTVNTVTASTAGAEIELSGGTTVANLTANQNLTVSGSGSVTEATVTGGTLIANASVANVTVPTTATGVTIAGTTPVEKVTASTSVAINNPVENLTVNAAGTTITVGAGVKVQSITTDKPVTLTGDGKVAEVNVTVSNITISQSADVIGQVSAVGDGTTGVSVTGTGDAADITITVQKKGEAPVGVIFNTATAVGGQGTISKTSGNLNGLEYRAEDTTIWNDITDN